ncbi:uncharacterized protein LOC108104312 [Drosophila eugracilis]|uniref:uncharacterized protein LOC108104312 n=1 Tax=Drosophila eugracilis TaxID=29029 RepID=UPI0007E7FCEB|nr:uncharacterized protein LOC108104312 [Drosophila eugracilis]
MFKIRFITGLFSRLLDKIFYHDYRKYSIWKFCPLNSWNQILNMVQSCTLCRTESFPIVFWLVFLISLFGLVHHCIDLWNLWHCGCGNKLSMWRQRNFYVLNYSLLRRVRFIGNTINAISWLMLFYGIIMISPHAMTPWILVNSIIQVMEWLMWSFEVITGRLVINVQTILSLILHLSFLGLVCCVKSVFEVALIEHVDHLLRIIDADRVAAECHY